MEIKSQFYKASQFYYLKGKQSERLRGEYILGTGECLKEIFKLIEENKPKNRYELLFKWSEVAADLGYEVSFDEQ